MKNREVQAILDYRKSDAFDRLTDGTTYGQYLKNRIESAFKDGIEAGIKVAQARLADCLSRNPDQEN